MIRPRASFQPCSDVRYVVCTVLMSMAKVLILYYVAADGSIYHFSIVTGSIISSSSADLLRPFSEAPFFSRSYSSGLQSMMKSNNEFFILLSHELPGIVLSKTKPRTPAVNMLVLKRMAII